MGKAAEAMTRGAAESLARYEAALVITKSRADEPTPRSTVFESGHPVPDERSIAAGQAAMRFASGLATEDLLICLISGGGSALATCPVAGVSLGDLQALTTAALISGADIEDVNNLRRCLDLLKGGGLAAATKAHVLGLILSDVIGDRLEAIASGPTVPCPTDPSKAIQLLGRLRSSTNDSIENILKSPATRPANIAGARIDNVIVGNARTAAEGAHRQARTEGFAAEILDVEFVGEAQLVGRALGNRLAMESKSLRRPACLIAVGESTVKLSSPHGTGGRNQELALAAVDALDSVEDCMLISLATDGEDGPTDAAGAVVTGTTAARGRVAAMIPSEFLQRHDSHSYFGALGDLLRPGYTGTNVNDIVLMLAL